MAKLSFQSPSSDTAKATKSHAREKKLKTTITIPAKSSRARQSGQLNVSFAGKSFTASPVLDTFFKFVVERHAIHQRRLDGQPPPWTDDELFCIYPFTNVFRVYDGTTQYILTNVINKGDQGLYESCFRVILFRFFNRVETWELLEETLGTPTLTWAEFNVEAYEEVLSRVTGPLYGGCYIIPAPNFGYQRNYSNHLRLIQVLMEEDFPGKLKQREYLKDAHGMTCMYPSMGSFTGLQLILDLNMLPHFNFSENEWAALGPGSSECIRKIFGPSIRGHEEAALRWLYETQMSHFARLRIPKSRIPRLCTARPAGMTMVDIEHALCECEKYSREKHPEIKGKHSVVGNPFKPSSKPITAHLPEKWLNPPPRLQPLPRPPPVRLAEDADDLPEYEVSHIVNGEVEVEIERELGWSPVPRQVDWLGARG
ncbi:hypothetical protein NLI96_g11663 [Meripilus lineatus]|uniref:5-hmdU DNA kinase helical domain-containing protein n=1 Tax=Meripilus lineatus TaxID=2056292 RepID=A0AAD5Y8X5_9APHY|nr:hypothetical protein NLI96_g11663 [Physisporinus lineatus]